MDEDEAATLVVVVVVVVAEDEEDNEDEVAVVEEEEAGQWAGKESSCPFSEERREQARRSTVCRVVQRRSNGMHCSVTLMQPRHNTERRKCIEQA